MKRLVAVILGLMVALGGAPALAHSSDCPILELGDYFPLKEPIKLTALVINTAGQASVAGSYVLDWIKEKTNIDLEIQYEWYGSDGATQLSLLMASAQRLPDILLCTRWSKAECALYGAQGLVIPLGDYLKECKNWNRLNEICGERRIEDLTMSDGSIYCFGSVNECYHLTHQARMWVYQPWIDQLMSGRLPQTTDEFYDYLYKVRTMDPNGNGLQDEIPLTGQIDEGWATDPFTFLSNAFVHNNRILGSTNPVVAPGWYVAPGGEVRCNWVEDEYREALRYTNKLYSGGLLDSQTFTQNGEQMQARLEAQPHLVGAAPGGLIPESSYAFASDNDGWKNWTCLPPLRGPKGVQLCYQSDYDYFYNCNGLITRDCENPEAAIQLFDILSSTEGTLVQGNGQQDVNWAYCDEADGVSIGGTAPLFRYVDPVQSAGWPPDVHVGASFLAYRNAMLMEEGTFNGERALIDWTDLYHPFSPGLESVYPNIAYTAEQSRRIAQYTATINSYVEQVTVQFITGSLSVDSDWEAYLTMLDSMDQQGYQALMQQAYDNLGK